MLFQFFSNQKSFFLHLKNPEMLRFAPDHLKTKQMCKHAVKKFLFVIRYVSD